MLEVPETVAPEIELFVGSSLVGVILFDIRPVPCSPLFPPYLLNELLGNGAGASHERRGSSCCA